MLLPSKRHVYYHQNITMKNVDQSVAESWNLIKSLEAVTKWVDLSNRLTNKLQPPTIEMKWKKGFFKGVK